MSAFRVGSSDDMAVDGEGIDPPTDEWMQRAQMAAETDGIIENAPAKRWYHLQLHIATLVTSCAVWGGRREGPCTTRHLPT